jgi:hypothetical protein
LCCGLEARFVSVWHFCHVRRSRDAAGKVRCTFSVACVAGGVLNKWSDICSNIWSDRGIQCDPLPCSRCSLSPPHCNGEGIQERALCDILFPVIHPIQHTGFFDLAGDNT